MFSVGGSKCLIEIFTRTNVYNNACGLYVICDCILGGFLDLSGCVRRSDRDQLPSQPIYQFGSGPYS